MTKLTPARLALGTVGLAIGMVGVLALREATLSTHEAVTARQVELVVSAKTAGGEAGQTLAEMVEAQLLTCRLEVTSDQPARSSHSATAASAPCWCRRWTRPTAASSAAAWRTS